METFLRTSKTSDESVKKLYQTAQELPYEYTAINIPDT